MDAEVAAIVSASATTILQLMLTDGWEQAKERISGLFGKHGADPAVVGQQLDQARAQLPLEVREDGSMSMQASSEMTSILRGLLDAHPTVATELAATLFDLSSGMNARDSRMNIKMNARASDDVRVYQQGQGIQHNG